MHIKADQPIPLTVYYTLFHKTINDFHLFILYNNNNAK
jgi:hypothetical protein